MPTPIFITRIRCAWSVLAALLVHSSTLWAQQPAAPPPPPPRLDASAQFTFLDTKGNAESQSLGAGGALTWRPDHTAALNVALNSILSLKLSHILRNSAEPPVGFDSTDSITAVSLVAKVFRPQ